MKYLSFDLRALALMRICISCVILLDLCIRLSDLEAFYSDSGVAPISMIIQHAWNKYFISFHLMSGLWQVQMILFAIAFFCAAMVLIGFRTQLFTILSWVMMLSLHNRNVLILQGGDDLLRMVLFWGIFIPWGARYSCDAIADPSQMKENHLQSMALVAYILQICYIYTGSALLKGAEWNTYFTALYYTYSLDQIAYPITKYIYNYPELLRILTIGAYYFELLIPLFFFIPIKHQWFRAIAVFAIIFFHSINLITLFIGLFPAIGISTSLGILPSSIMDKFDRIIQPLKKILSKLKLAIFNNVNRIIKWEKPVYYHSQLQQNIKNGLLAFLIVFVFDWNFSNLTFVNSKLSDNLRFIGYGLRLDQSWGMFAPGVFKDDGWFILEGTTQPDEQIDLLHEDKKLTLEKPKSVVSMFKNDRWRKYSENYILASNTFMRGYFCNYYKRIWNETHIDKPINTLKVIFMAETTLPDYKKVTPIKNILWECK